MVKPPANPSYPVPPIRPTKSVLVPLSYFEKLHGDINAVNSDMAKILKGLKDERQSGFKSSREREPYFKRVKQQ